MQTQSPPLTPPVEAPPRRRKRKWIILGVVVFLVVAVGAVLYRPLKLLADGERIDVGGRDVYVLCRGTGTPTVLIEHGLGADGTEWSTVQDAIAEDTTVCFTSRAGRGFSTGVDGDRTARDAADDLAAVVDGAGLSGPYVLVGHSFGGHVVRLFAADRPDDVVGMVLVDSSHEAQGTMLRRQLPANIWDQVAGFFGADNVEHMDLEASAAQVAAAGDLGSIPLVVLRADQQRTDADAAGITQATADELDRAMNRLWPDLQRELAGLSSQGRLVFAEGSGHFIHVDQPDLVIEAIRSVLDA